MKGKMQSKISVIIPAFNEHKVIKKTISELTSSLKKNKIKYEVIVVDDGSTDGTIEIVKKISKSDKNVKIFVRKSKPGFGFSLIDGTKMASNDIVVWVMGDSSDNFDTIPRMIKKINSGADIVVGSRNMPGGSRGDQDKLKAIGSIIYSRLAKILFRLPVYDITNAFRAFRKKVIYSFEFENNNFAVSPELSLRAHIRGYKLAEVPTTYKERKIGEAKTKLFSMGLFYYVMLIRYWFRNLFGKL